MAVLEGPLYGTQAHGRLKNTIAFHTRQGWARMSALPRAKTKTSASRQQIRDTFAQAAETWQNMTFEEQGIYNAQATGLLTGYNLFIREAFQ